MKRRNIVFISVFLLISFVAIWMLERHRTENNAKPSHAISSSASLPPSATPFPTPIISKSAHQLPGGPYAPADPRWAKRRKLREADRSYEWKTPIRFFGKVLDQNQQPVSGVEVKLNWTDMSSKGTSEATRITDASGGFSLVGVQGKTLGIRSLIKEGYEEFLGSNQYSFEYAGFWEPIYYVPDPKKPAIFYLRKYGEPAPLLTSEGKTVVNIGTESLIPMPQTTGAPSLSPIKVTVMESDGKGRTWKAQVSVDGGGIVPTTTEFPVEAPKEGYVGSITLSQDSPQPVGWQSINEGGRFYIKTNQGFGLLELRQMKGKKTLHYKVLLNSKGGTNLEPARH